MCVLHSLSHFGPQDRKENKSSWPEMLDVDCDLLLTLKVKCPDSLKHLLKQSSSLNDKVS